MDVNSSVSPFDSCARSILTQVIFTSWFLVYLLFLPVFLLVLYIGFNKWRRSAAGGLSHSDVFTLHMVLMEMMSIVASCVVIYGFLSSYSELLKVGSDVNATTATGQVLFHSLTCVERYLAVVHPVSYLRLRRGGGATLRNTCVALAWVLSVGFSLHSSLLNEPRVYGIYSLVFSISPVPLVSYCSIYVLCVLTRPKPGEGGGLRRQMDQSKRSTVYTMAAILAALLFRFLFQAVVGCIIIVLLEEVDICVGGSATLWSYLPSSLVLPLLLLHRTGRLRRARK